MKESAVRVPSDLSGKVGSPTTLEETVRPLIELSIKGLERMWMKDQGLFCFTVRDGQNGPAPEGVSLRYTAITLLGLHRAATNGWPVPLDLKSILRQTIDAAPTTRNIGTLALILWAGAALTQKVDPKVEAAIRSHGPFYQEAGNGVYATTELAWLLIAMIEAAEITTGAERHRFEETAHLAYRLLKRNFNSRSSLFAFSTQLSSSWTRPLRSRLGFFDGQVYGIYSFAQYARHFSDGEALSHAKHCAERICDFQGGRGEWAWHYNALRGKMVDRYPVYAVHQHGMAPLALKGLSEISTGDYRVEITRGLRYLFGENPLGFQFVDEAHSVIWRSMKRRSPMAKAIYINKVASFVGPTGWISALDHPSLMMIDRECRPYELGWLLFAFSDIPPKKEGGHGPAV
ncbi:MAG: hypothetical protein MCM46_13505 [Candidatus Manganitrophus sp. SB1]|nr:hypothetical protein [Candidatus Manganitrophus morganii]